MRSEILLRGGRVARGFDGFDLGLSQAQNIALPGIFQGTSAQDSWNQIATQIQAEGAAGVLPGGSVPNSLATAQQQYLSKLQSFIDSGITQVQPNLATLAQAAQTATLATNTAYGAVNAIQGIQAGIAAGNPQAVEAGVQALLGVITTAAISVGAVSAGVGAAIGAAIELTVEILNAAGIIPGLPPNSIQVGDGHCSNQGFTSTGQNATGGTVPVNLKDGLVSPGANGEGVCVWGPLFSPGSTNWRTFPDPNNANDATLWYTAVTEATWYWGQAKWYTKNVGNWRPIDNAFHRYRQLECDDSLNYVMTQGGGPGISTETLTGDIATAVPAFLAAYFHMWKKNAEFALNGLTPAPDTLVLEQMVATWNAAHEQGTGFAFTPAPNDLQGTEEGPDCNAVTGGFSYVSMVVADSGRYELRAAHERRPGHQHRAPTQAAQRRILHAPAHRGHAHGRRRWPRPRILDDRRLARSRHTRCRRPRRGRPLRLRVPQ